MKDGILYVIRDFCDEGDLSKKLMKKNGTLSEDEVISILK